MPKFYRRVGGGNAYVRGLANGRYCTWQVSSAATEALIERGYTHGDQLPKWLFSSLLEQGHLYTGESGLGPEAPPIIKEPHGCGCGSCLITLLALGGTGAACMLILAATTF